MQLNLNSKTEIKKLEIRLKHEIKKEKKVKKIKDNKGLKRGQTM